MDNHRNSHRNGDIIIRSTSDTDLEAALAVERAAFGTEAEANLVRELLNDATAQPTVSLLGWHKDQPVGHLLFTAVNFEPSFPRMASLLAPLAVIPEYQKQGIGSQLVRHGLQLLFERDVELVFVLGHPSYYPRFGFQPAGERGFEAPFPIAEKNAPAWMVLALRGEPASSSRRTVRCANALNQPQYWRE